MNILIIAQEVDYEGDNLAFFHKWIEVFAKNSKTVHVVGNKIGKTHLPDNVSVYSLYKERGAGKLLRYARFYWNILFILPKVDLVFIHMCPEYVLALSPLNFFFKKPIVMWYAHVRVSPRAERALKYIKVVFGPSSEAFVHETAKHRVIGHGIDTERFRPIEDEKEIGSKPFRIVAQGRTSRVKEFEILIDAAKLLRDKYKLGDFTVSFIGGPMLPDDHVYLKELKDKTQLLGLSDRIEWVGMVPNREAAKWYQKGDVFCRTQEGGGFGKSDLEAVACGLPALTLTTAYRDVFPEYQDDLYYPASNREALAKHIVKIKEWSRERREKYRKLAHAYVKENHNVENTVQKILEESRKYVRN